MASKVYPVKNTAFTFRVQLYAQSDNQVKTTPTLAAGDFKCTTDGGTYSNLATTPSESPSGSGWVLVSLSASEMNGDEINIGWIDASGAEWHSGGCTLFTIASGHQLDSLATSAEIAALNNVSTTDLATALTNYDAVVPADLASLATAANLQTVDDNIDAIKAKTDNLPIDPAGISDLPDISALALEASVQGLNDISTTDLATALTNYDAVVPADLVSLATSAEIAALNDISAGDVWDETLALHLGAGSTGAALNAAGAAGDPWSTALPGAYGAGSAGYIIGNLNDISEAEVNAQVDAALADYDAVIPADLAALALEASVQAVKAKTDNLPASPAAVGSAMTLDAGTITDIVDDVWDEPYAGHTTAGSMGQLAQDIDSEIDVLHRASILVDTTIQSAGRSTTTVRLTTGSDQNDAYIGMSIILDSDEGNGVYVSRAITAYDGATRQITFTPALIHDPVDNGLVYIVPGDLHNDINILDILADTSELQTDDVPGLIAALNNISTADLATALTNYDAVVPADLAALALEASLQAVKAKTDNLPVDPAGISDLPAPPPSQNLDDYKADVTGLALSSEIAALNDLSLADIWEAQLASYSGVAGSVAEALELASGGSDPVVIAAAVWDRLLWQHTTPDSAGQHLQDAVIQFTLNDIGDEIWDRQTSLHDQFGSFGRKISDQVNPPSQTLNDYKADVSALALEATVNDVITTLVTDGVVLTDAMVISLVQAILQTGVSGLEDDSEVLSLVRLILGLLNSDIAQVTETTAVKTVYKANGTPLEQQAVTIDSTGLPITGVRTQ